MLFKDLGGGGGGCGQGIQELGKPHSTLSVMLRISSRQVLSVFVALLFIVVDSATLLILSSTLPSLDRTCHVEQSFLGVVLQALS